MALWEVGILLMGIGVLILCIFAATTVRDLGASIKRIDRMLTDKNGEIDTIINNVASISTEVEGITTNINRVSDVVGFVSSVSSGIASRFKKNEAEAENSFDDLFDDENVI